MGVITIFICGTILFTTMLEALRHQLDHRLQKRARDGDHIAVAAQELVLALYRELSVLGLVSCPSIFRIQIDNPAVACKYALSCALSCAMVLQSVLLHCRGPDTVADLRAGQALLCPAKHTPVPANSVAATPQASVQ